MGGQGGGFYYNVEELRTIVANGLDLSMTHQCLIEESILGWEELEVEVVRDSKNQMVAICTIENIDAVGVHTGDSFCAAPFMTIDKNLGVPVASQRSGVPHFANAHSYTSFRNSFAGATYPNAFLPKTFSVNTKTFVA